MKMDGQN